MKESTEGNIFGVTFDQSLSLKEHVKTLCKKDSQKRHTLSRVSCYIDTEKLHHLMRAFVLAHFSYFVLVCMFYDRAMNHRKSHIHKRALCIAHKDHGNGFGYLLEQSNSVPTHVRNLQLQMTEIIIIIWHK